MQPAIIFDFGGVFMKTVDYSPRHRWDDRLRLPHGSVERVVHGSASWRAAQTGLLTPDAYREDVRKQLGLTETDLGQLFDDYFSGDQLDLTLVDYARGLRARGYPVALLSNDSVELGPKLERLGITDVFDPQVISAHIGVMKPDAGAYEHVLSKLGYAAANTVFIDDMPTNIAGAEAVEMHGILYREIAALREQLESLLAAR
jgi:HAD superfamily hydrolase (TIGR01509 family)